MNTLAHVPWLDGGHFFNGIIHPVMTVSHLLAIAGIALAAGLSGAEASRKLLGGVVAGGVVAFLLPVSIGSLGNGSVLAGAFAAGAVAAVDKGVGFKLAAAMGMWTSAGIVVASRAETDLFTFSSGVVLGLVLAVLLLTGAANGIMRNGRYRIALRVAGSWIAAAALVNLALVQR